MSRGLAPTIFPFLKWAPQLKHTWKNDLIAGLTGMVIVIPQAVAFAMIAGLPPIYGFYTAMITPIVVALFGSSYHLVSGPTTAMSIVVFATISKFADPETEVQAFVALTITLTFITGIIQFLMGLVRLGKLVNFVSHSVVVGFTAGAAVLIAFKQIKHIFSIPVPNGSNVFEIVQFLSLNIGDSNGWAILIGLGTLLIAIMAKKLVPKLSLLIAILLGTVLSVVLGGESLGLETVGEIPGQLPPLSAPEMKWDVVRELFPGAVVLAMLGLIEAVAISKSIALKSHQKLDSNQEFLGQGLSNIVGSFFSSYVGSGSFTRSGVNYQAGAQTPMSAIFAAIFLALVLLLIAPLASYLPKATMGGVILLVGYNLIDFAHIKRIYKSSKREMIVFVVTFLGTILFKELEYALIVGMLTSLLFYMERTSNPNIAVMALNKFNNFQNIERNPKLRECPQLKVIRIDGSIYFGAVEKISNYFDDLDSQTGIVHVLIEAQGVNFIDLAGAEWMTHEAHKWQEKGGGIYFVGSKIISQDVLRQGGFLKEIGEENFFANKTEAIKYIYEKLDRDICNNCEARVFRECKTDSSLKPVSN